MTARAINSALIEALAEDARDRGDDWLLNLPRYRQFEDNLNVPTPTSPWMPFADAITGGSRGRAVSPDALMLHLVEPPPLRTRRSY